MASINSNTRGIKRSNEIKKKTLLTYAGDYHSWIPFQVDFSEKLTSSGILHLHKLRV